VRIEAKAMEKAAPPMIQPAIWSLGEKELPVNTSTENTTKKPPMTQHKDK